ncbi:hypothetical protein JW921_04245 [Candidatus Fermentibacterales bacterium]|nr:hypothetical protein [Candidatus Fermentibacterales bacterium]
MTPGLALAVVLSSSLPLPCRAEPPPTDPALDAARLVTDSLVEATTGRYGVRGLDMVHGSSFVLSEGGFFDCGHFPLLPVACAVSCRTAPPFSMLRFPPDSLVLKAWQGDSSACEALMLMMGKDTVRGWLHREALLATSLSEDTGSGLPYVSAVWDCAMMLRSMGRDLPASGVPFPGAPGLEQFVRDQAPPARSFLGCMSRLPGGCRAALAVELPEGRHLGLAVLVDSMESDSLVTERLGLLLGSITAEASRADRMP